MDEEINANLNCLTYHNSFRQLVVLVEILPFMPRKV